MKLGKEVITEITDNFTDFFYILDVVTNLQKHN